MSAAETLAKISAAIWDGTAVTKHGASYEDPAMTLATIEDILSDNPVEYKWRVVNKPLFKSYSYRTYEEATANLSFDGDSLQRKEAGSGWVDI